MNLPLLRRLVGLSLVLGLAGLLGCAGGTHPPANTGPLVVSVAQLEEGSAQDYEDFTGRTDAVQSVDIKAQVTGYLDKVLFKDGDDVKKDQLLYVIDKRPYQAAVENAKGALANTQAALTNAEAELTRARRMRLGAAISPEDFDKLVANRQQAAATLVSNKAALAQAELNLSFCDVKAPISGRISRTFITVGNLVTANQTALTRLVSMDPIYAYFDVDERTVLRVQRMIREEISESGIAQATDYLRKHGVPTQVVNQAVAIIRSRLTEANRRKLHDLLEGKLATADVQGLFAILEKNPRFQTYRERTVPVYLGTQIEEGYPHAGHIDFVENRLDPTTGTLRVRGVFPNREKILTPALFVRIRLPLGEPYKAVLISEEAVVNIQDRRFVYVVNDQDVVEMRAVTLGPLRNGMRVIQGGAEAGEWVIVRGLQKAQPGDKVQVRRVPMPAASSTPTNTIPQPPAVQAK